MNFVKGAKKNIQRFKEAILSWQAEAGAVGIYCPARAMNTLFKANIKNDLRFFDDNTLLHGSVRTLGFGRKTSIDLPGESAGIVLPLNRWTSYSQTSVPMGQELAVTPVQLVEPATTIHLFGVASSGEEEPSQQALLYATGGSLVTFVNLANLQERKERNLESISLPGHIESVTQLRHNRLLVTHSSTGLSVLDLNRRTITRIASEVSLR